MPNRLHPHVEEHGYAKGEHPDWVKRRALNFTLRFVAKGGRLVLGYAIQHKTGNLILTIAIAVGNQVFHSPSLDQLAIGLGVVTAARFLIEWTRKMHKRGSIGVEPGEIERLEGLSGATRGLWSDEDDWN